MFRIRPILFRSFSPPIYRFLLVCFHSMSKRVANPQRILCSGCSLLCGFLKPFDGYLLVFQNPFAIKKTKPPFKLSDWITCISFRFQFRNRHLLNIFCVGLAAPAKNFKQMTIAELKPEAIVICLTFLALDWPQPPQAKATKVKTKTQLFQNFAIVFYFFKNALNRSEER